MCRFPKIKEEGWFLVLGDSATGELLALKRLGVPVGRSTRTTLRFAAPPQHGDTHSAASVRLYLLSDSYIGLDQSVDVPVGGDGSADSRGRGELCGEYVRGAWPALDAGDGA